MTGTITNKRQQSIRTTTCNQDFFQKIETILTRNKEDINISPILAKNQIRKEARRNYISTRSHKDL